MFCFYPPGIGQTLSPCALPTLRQFPDTFTFRLSIHCQAHSWVSIIWCYGKAKSASSGYVIKDSLHSSTLRIISFNVCQPDSKCFKVTICDYSFINRYPEPMSAYELCEAYQGCGLLFKIEPSFLPSVFLSENVLLVLISPVQG